MGESIGIQLCFCALQQCWHWIVKTGILHKLEEELSTSHRANGGNKSNGILQA